MTSKNISSNSINSNLSWLFGKWCRNLIQASALITLVLFVFSSCTKEKQGSIVFWYTQSTSQSMQSDGVSSITVYLDNQIIGTYAVNTYAVKVPECGASGSVGITKELGKSKSKQFVYKVIDNFGNILWNGSTTIEAETCLNIELGL